MRYEQKIIVQSLNDSVSSSGSTHDVRETKKATGGRRSSVESSTRLERNPNRDAKGPRRHSLETNRPVTTPSGLCETEMEIIDFMRASKKESKKKRRGSQNAEAAGSSEKNTKELQKQHALSPPQKTSEARKPSQKSVLDSSSARKTGRRVSLPKEKLIDTVPHTSAKTVPKKRPCVHFCEDHNQYYPGWSDMTKQHLQSLWYNNEDITGWKSEMAQAVKDLVTAGFRTGGYSYMSWANCMLRAYSGFETANGFQEVQRIVACSKAVAPPSTIGLEKWVVRSMCNDRSIRRHEIFVQLQTLQQQPQQPHTKLWNNDTRAEKMRLVSRALSRPSRLFAHHIASLSAHEYKMLS